MKRSSFARGAPRLAGLLRAVLATAGLAAVATASFQGCRSDAPAGEAPRASSVTTQEEDARETTFSVETTTSDGRALWLQHTTSVTSSPDGIATRLTVTLDGKPALSVSSTTAIDGARRVTVEYGEGFQGIRTLAYESADGKSFTGSVDGRPLAPFQAGADAATLRFADGAAPPSVSVDPVVQSAIAGALEGVKQKLTSSPSAPSSTAEGSPALVPFGNTVYGVPGRYDNTSGTAECHGCIAAVIAGQVACDVAAAIACIGSFGLGCGEAIAACVEEAVVGLQACHKPDSACCPVQCGPTGFAGTASSCCYGGDTCLNPSAPGLCCGPGTQACGGKVCCTADAPCRPGVNICCPATQQTCGTGASAVCCNAGDACIAGSCCPANQVANDGTCCPVPTLNGECCPPGEIGVEACNGSCCTGTCCGNLCCPTGQACTTAGACCGVGQAGCGALCCPAGQVCLDPSTSQCSAPSQAVLEFWNGTTGTLGDNTCSGSPCEVETWGVPFQVRGTGFPQGTVTITVPSPSGTQTFTATADATQTFVATLTVAGVDTYDETITATETVNGTTYTASVLAELSVPPP